MEFPFIIYPKGLPSWSGIIGNPHSRRFHANESPMNKTNILYTHRHPSHPFLYSYLQLSFHHKSSSDKSPYLNLQYLSNPYLTHHFQLILFTHSLISPFPWFHYQQPTTSKSAKPFSVLHVFFFFLPILCFVLWGFLDSWASWKRQKSRFWVWLWLLWQLWMGLHISIPLENPKRRNESAPYLC